MFNEIFTQGIDVWAITTQNEPSMGLFVSSKWNANGFTPKHMLGWLIKDLLPKIDKLK